MGAGRYFDETQHLQLTTNGRFINRDAELFEYPLRQILAAPAHHTVDRRDRTTFDEPGKGLALAIIELGWLARRFAINQTIGTFGVETRTQSLTTCRPTDPIHAASRRLPPSKIAANASNRRICPASFEDLANRRNSGPSKSARKVTARPIVNLLFWLTTLIQTFQRLGIP